MQKCIYCDDAPATTSDHVPPKILIPTPYPRNLYTVPACEACNSGFQKDDEYFRSVLTARVGVDEDPDGRAVLERSLRHLGRPQAQATLDAFARSSGLAPIVGDEGNVIELAPAYEVDADRVRAALGHIVRGLFWRHTGRPMRPSVEIRCSIDPDVDPELMQTVLSALRGRGLHEVPRVFDYAWAEPAAAPFFSMWLFEFYRTARFVVITGNPNEQHGGRAPLDS